MFNGIGNGDEKQVKLSYFKTGNHKQFFIEWKSQDSLTNCLLMTAEWKSWICVKEIQIKTEKILLKI